MTFRPVLVLCLLAAPLLQAEGGLLDYLPPGTSFAIGVKVRSLIDSPMAKGMAGEMRKAGAELNQMISLSGFDPLQDVDEVLVGAVGEGPTAQGLMMLSGRFASARKKATGAPYKGVMIGGKLKGSTAFLDDSTMIVGDLPMVRAAIDRRGKPSSSELRSKIAEMAGQYDIYGVGKLPDGAMAGEGMALAAKGIEQFQFGVKVGRGLDMVAELRARTDQDAQAIAQTVQLLSAMAAQQQGGAEMAKSLGVKMDGRTLRLSLAVSEADLKKAVEARRNTPPPMVAPKVTASSGRPAVAKTPERDKRFSPDTVLVITGAESDGGVTVIRDPKKN